MLETKTRLLVAVRLGGQLSLCEIFSLYVRVAFLLLMSSSRTVSLRESSRLGLRPLICAAEL